VVDNGVGSRKRSGPLHDVVSERVLGAPEVGDPDAFEGLAAEGERIEFRRDVAWPGVRRLNPVVLPLGQVDGREVDVVVALHLLDVLDCASECLIECEGYETTRWVSSRRGSSGGKY